jgi:large subunit ribosomal protein L25
MSVDFNINVESRSDIGKGASRRLRHAGQVPGIIYGSGQDPVSITTDHNQLAHHLEHEAFYSHILTVTLDGKTENVVLKDLQRHPAKPRILHIDFLRVGDNDTIHMQVPVHFVNEEESVGVKGGGLVSHLVNAIEIICKAKDLPEFLSVDIASLDVGSALHLSDIELPTGVTIAQLAHGADHDLPIVSIHAPKGAAEEEESDVAAEAEGEDAAE